MQRRIHDRLVPLHRGTGVPHGIRDLFLPSEQRRRALLRLAIPHQAAEAVWAIPPMSEMYFFWSGNGRPETAVRGWRRSLEHVYTAADLKRNGKKLRAHTHMLRHTFAIEKLNAGASLEDVSLLLAHRSIKITERHYLKFDQRRQDRLTRAAMVDFEQAETPQSPKRRRARVIQMPVGHSLDVARR